MSAFLPPEVGPALQVCFQSIAKLFLVAMIGFIPVRRGLISEAVLFRIVRIVVDTVVPITISLALLKGFSGQALAKGSLVVFVNLGWILGGFALGTALFRSIPGGTEQGDRTATAMCAIQNSFYLPIPLVAAILPKHLQSEAMLYLGLAILVTNPLQWTLGTYLLRSRTGAAPTWKETLRSTLNGPTVGVVIGIGLGLVPGLSEHAKLSWNAPGVLGPIFGFMHVVSGAMGNIAMVVLGGLLGAAKLDESFRWRTFGVVTAVKLLTAPLVCYVALQAFFPDWDPLVKFVLVLEASSPPAVNLALAARRFGGDWQLCSTTMFPVYLVALVTMPLWVALELAQSGLAR